jgi:hypothetical protein
MAPQVPFPFSARRQSQSTETCRWNTYKMYATCADGTERVAAPHHIFAIWKWFEYSRRAEAATCTPACRPAAVDTRRSRPETPSSRPTSVRATCRRTLRKHNWHLVSYS